MAVRALEDETAFPRTRPHLPSGIGWLLVAAIAFVALIVGAVGTLGYESIRSAADANTTNRQAASLDQGLQAQLNVESFSGGQIVGSLHTEGDFVDLAEHMGGILLSFTNGATREPGAQGHTADVMLGLSPGVGTTIPAGSYPIRCYRYTFGNASWSVQQSSIPCPARRTDGQPGSVQAQMGALLAIQPVLRGSPLHPAPAGYPLNAGGAQELLANLYIFPDNSPVSHPFILSGESGPGVFAAAIQRDGACFYLRMSAPSAAPPNQADALWLAPADDQTPTTCDAQHALSASGLYGINGAQEG
jgi:hypothetical protein